MSSQKIRASKGVFQSERGDGSRYSLAVGESVQRCADPRFARSRRLHQNQRSRPGSIPVGQQITATALCLRKHTRIGSAEFAFQKGKQE